VNTGALDGNGHVGGCGAAWGAGREGGRETGDIGGDGPNVGDRGGYEAREAGSDGLDTDGVVMMSREGDNA
jgi:hypothetical protein